MAKLTKPQIELLGDLEITSVGVSDTYDPAKKLVSLGYASWSTSSFGSTYLTITDAGRTALQEASNGK